MDRKRIILQKTIMSSSISTLNPYADSYVPISKREVTNKEKSSKTLTGEAPAVSDPHPNMDGYKLKAQQVEPTHDASPEYSHEIDSKFTDEESEMDLAYLQMMFPGISDQSLSDVYNVNSGDLDASLDMLNHLEAVDHPPDALGIEQTEKPVSSGESSSVNAAPVTGESSNACAAVSAVSAVAT